MRLKPSARLQRYLGRELIADPNLAVLEFVKNAYDAGASDVRVEFELGKDPSRLTIADNGVGMDEASFRANWLRPGFSSKSLDYDGPDIRTTKNKDASKRSATRSPAGEKGLGRLAAGRLGGLLRVFTRPSVDVKWLVVTFDWATFDNMNLQMDEIPIPYDFVDQAPDGAYDLGTVVEIEDLTQNWGGRIPGRPAPGRPRTRLGRLKQDLAFLVRGEGGDRDFSILLDSDEYVDTADIGIVDEASASADSASYMYDFSIELSGSDSLGEPSVEISRKLRRSGDVAQRTGKPAVEDLGVVTIRESDLLDRGLSLSAGPVEGRFFYTPPPAARRARDVDAAASGVLVYRDDVLVEPYGLGGDDWLGVEARKASRQGHAAIQPSTFSGEVRIARRTNPELLDMSNRLGLIDNQASADFFFLVSNEFSYFESIIYEEVLVEDRWAGKKEGKAQEQAAFAERLANVRLRAIAHRAGQPLQALGFDLASLEAIAADPSLKPEVAEKLRSLASGIEANLRRLGTVVSELTDVLNLEFRIVSVLSLVERIVSDLGGVIARHGVHVTIDGDDEHTVLVPEALAFEALSEVITNAVEAPRPDARPAEVSVKALASDSNFIEVIVSDNGGGIPLGHAGMPVAAIESTKGRPAEGMVAAETAAIAARGELRVLDTSREGTTIAIRLPRKVRPQ
jgi:signal transduction histidine kinase